MRVILPITAILMCQFAATAFGAPITWDSPGSSGDWGTVDNWSPAQVPGSEDTIDLTGAGTEITVSGNQAFYGFTNKSVDGTLTVRDGGVLTGWGTGTSDFRASGISLVVEAGGQFIGAGTDQLLRMGNVTINSGGQLDGFATFQALDLVNNGIFSPTGSTASDLIILNGSGGLSLTGSGVLRLDVFGSNDNETIQFGNAPVVDFSGFSSIELIPDYSVQIGDTFDLWTLGGGTVADLESITFGSGENLVLANSPGLALDVSQWATEGIVSVSAVSAVPEPSTVSFLIGASMFALVPIWRKRKQR